MGAAIKIFTVQDDELRQLIREELTQLLAQAFEKEDELLNIGQLCGRVEGLTRHTFKNLCKTTSLKQIDGKYSLKAVKAALQSRSL